MTGFNPCSKDPDVKKWFDFKYSLLIDRLEKKD